MRGETRLGSDGDPLKVTNKKPEMTKVDLWVSKHW